MDSEYMTVAEARMALGFSKSKMAGLIKRGKIPWTPDGRDSRIKLIRREVVEEWLKRPRHIRGDTPKIETAAAA